MTANNEYLNKCIVYAGSDVFSIPSLQRLLDLKYKKIIVLTKPPKRQGRGMKVKNNPLAEFSSHQNIETLMPENPNDNDLLERLKAAEPEALITSAYGKMVSEDLLEIFSLGNKFISSITSFIVIPIMAIIPPWFSGTASCIDLPLSFSK